MPLSTLIEAYGFELHLYLCLDIKYLITLKYLSLIFDGYQIFDIYTSNILDLDTDT